MPPKLWLSLQVASAATGGGLAPGIWLAYRIALREGVARRLLTGALALLWGVPLILAAWSVFRRPLLKTTPVDLPSLPWQAGAAAGFLGAMAIVVLVSRARIQEVNRAYGNAARSLGSSEWRIFWRVLLPLAWPVLLAAAALAFVRVWVEWTLVAAL